MPDPQPPQPQQGGRNSRETNRQQPVPAGPPVQKVLEGPVLDQGQGHQEGQHQQHWLSIHAEGVLAVLPGAVGEDVMTSRPSVVKKQRVALTRNRPKNTAAPQRITGPAPAPSPPSTPPPRSGRRKRSSPPPAGLGPAWWVSCPGRGAGRGGPGAGPGCRSNCAWASTWEKLSSPRRKHSAREVAMRITAKPKVSWGRV